MIKYDFQFILYDEMSFDNLYFSSITHKVVIADQKCKKSSFKLGYMSRIHFFKNSNDQSNYRINRIMYFKFIVLKPKPKNALCVH